MSSYIVSRAPAAVTDAMKTALKTHINAMDTYKVGLNNEQKAGARTMAAGREGLARMICKIAKAHIKSLARDMDPADLEAMLDYDAQLEDGRQLLMAALEITSETQLANGVDAMALVDAFAANLQASRKLNAALDMAMAEVDEWNARFGRDQKVPPTP